MKIISIFKKLARLAVNLLSFLFWAMILFGFNSPSVAVLTLLAALIHECGHIAAQIFTENFRGLPHFSLCGMKLRSVGRVCYKDELLILAAGPAANLFTFLFFYLLTVIFGGGFFIFALLNLFTAIGNLAPLYDTDGYKIITLLYSSLGLGFGAWRALSAVSFAFTVILTFLSLYLIMKVGDGFWIFIIFFFSLLNTLFNSKNIKKRDITRFKEKKRAFQSF